MNKILITGGAGFIGYHLTRCLIASGYEVRILDNLSSQIHGPLPSGLEWLLDEKIEFRRGSVTSRNDLSEALRDVEAVVHLAAETGTAQSMYEIARYNLVNVQGTALLLDVLANETNHNVQRIVLASSRSVYGEGAYVCRFCAPEIRVYPDSRTPEHLSAHCWDPLCATCGQPLQAVPTREDDQVKPASIYAATKLAQEDLLRISCSSLGIGYSILRLQNVYGERQSLNNPYTGILSIFSTRIRRNLFLPIFEDGKETRDFVHVDDVVKAFVSALEIPQSVNGVINVGTGLATSVAEIASTLCEVFGYSPNLVITNQYRLGDIRHNRADINRLVTHLNFTPKIRLLEGLERFADWVKKQELPRDLLDKANAELVERNLMG
ncbi:TPA: NAD-dependent epimerase/dehydratase family protein [Legionella pneumophila]|uniref:NAD-dependent epimerase/dehydratase family protein n=1 Tax=Legionella pneumophila TaxID=446 RepID=UPI0005C431C9|nr:NAD-dependent epimerase/dehydratase family protein [Legionella pneumophila]HAT9434017.1 NAD-dependent epimerase/dehydratase family protein [Legionella pneumophila subsp. pneumophila]MCK1887573.1 NAD-dependent epimerase/dehydratase family protein [Legionella pneumophila]MCW8406537.1 NAD-dependent epimerase/dehydratase family protein [Legionella pneumophila]RYB35690.1 NAD-dependent epimerase/dehydratase family protein [Legionella pneumophila]RYB42963.1 NAD-dependent epimerase/dehydratase fami